jgi:serine/threonine protein phosphatase PrpC
MAAFMTLPSHAVDVNAKLNQLSKKQDYIICEQAIDNETGELFNWCAVFDGHGSDDCIQFIREIPITTMNNFISSKNPIENLYKYINQRLKMRVSSGSTMCLTKIYQNRIVCSNCGDSKAAIYKNGKIEFVTQEHSFQNKNEFFRLANNVTYLPSSDIEIVDDSTLVSVYSEYIRWNIDYTKLSCSQALGHNGNTGYAPDYETISYNEGDSLKIIIATDGFWDMVIKDEEEEITNLLKMQCKDLLDFAVKRWLQEWEMYTDIDAEHYSKCCYNENQCDDVGVVTVDIVPKILYE